MLVLFLTALVLLVCLVLLSSLCLHCHKRPMVSIRQTHTSEDTYIPSTQFLTNRPMQYSIDPNYVHPPSHFLSPHFSLEGTQRPPCPSFTPTETESNNSYENAASCGCLDSEEEGVPDPGYIEVLPETAPPVATVSRPSSPSSESEDDSYENAEHNYVNVGEPDASISQSQASTRSCDQLGTNQSQDSSEHSDSDDEGDYVNQPSHPGA